MAIKKKKSLSLQNILAITGVVLTALSIFLGFYYNDRDRILKAQELAEKKRLDSISQANEYFKTEKSFRDENLKLAEAGKESLPIVIHNNSDTGLALCIHYLSLNRIWVTAGHFLIRPGQSISFDERTNYPELYISVAYHNGTPVNDRRVIANANDLSLAGYYERAIREKEAFMLISDVHAPYQTTTVKFYEVKPDSDNQIYIELENRRLAADLTAMASKYHLVSPHSKKDSIGRIAKKLLGRFKK